MKLTTKPALKISFVQFAMLLSTLQITSANAEWSVSYGGVSAPEPYSNHSTLTSSMLIGQFDDQPYSDVFSTNDGAWFFSSEGKSDWTKLLTADAKATHLALVDFNGDKISDVFSTGEGEWNVSYSGTGRWNTIKSDTETVENLRFGDFDGNNTTDVLKIENGKWYLSLGGSSKWKHINTQDVSIDQVLIGDFDQIKGADVFVTLGGRWYYSSAGSSDLMPLAHSERTADELLIGNFDEDEISDVFHAGGGIWSFSSGGKSDWIELRKSKLVTKELLLGRFNDDKLSDVLAVQPSTDTRPQPKPVIHGVVQGEVDFVGFEHVICPQDGGDVDQYIGEVCPQGTVAKRWLGSSSGRKCGYNFYFFMCDAPSIIEVDTIHTVVQAHPTDKLEIPNYAKHPAVEPDEILRCAVDGYSIDDLAKEKCASKQHVVYHWNGYNGGRCGVNQFAVACFVSKPK